MKIQTRPMLAVMKSAGTLHPLLPSPPTVAMMVTLGMSALNYVGERNMIGVAGRPMILMVALDAVTVD